MKFHRNFDSVTTLASCPQITNNDKLLPDVLWMSYTSPRNIQYRASLYSKIWQNISAPQKIPFFSDK